MSKDKKEDKSLRIPQKEKIRTDLQIRNLPWTEKQKELIRLAQEKDTKIILCKGPAGTAKTLIAVYCALEALNQKKCSEIIYVRSAVESTLHPLGYLKGSMEEKISPYLQPLMDKIQELLPKNQADGLVNQENVRGIPVGFLRGLSLNVAYVIADEAQNLSQLELLTIMTRLGRHSRMFLLADEKQQDVKNSGYTTVYNAFNNEESIKNGIKTFEFTKEDIMREDVIKYIIDVFENIDNIPTDWTPKKK